MSFADVPKPQLCPTIYPAAQLISRKVARSRYMANDANLIHSVYSSMIRNEVYENNVSSCLIQVNERGNLCESFRN